MAACKSSCPKPTFNLDYFKCRHCNGEGRQARRRTTSIPDQIHLKLIHHSCNAKPREWLKLALYAGRSVTVHLSQLVSGFATVELLSTLFPCLYALFAATFALSYTLATKATACVSLNDVQDLNQLRQALLAFPLYCSL
jgi:hypothetical protein